MTIFGWLFLAGLVGGFIAGLIGIGGGIIYIFILPDALLYMGCPEQHLSQAIITNSLAAIFFASFSANIQLWRNKNFYFKPVLLVGTAAVISSWLTYEFIVKREWYDVRTFNIISIILMLYMLWITLASAKTEGQTDHTQVNNQQYILAGLGGGIIAALSGLGGGIIIIPVLNVLLKLGVRKASSISSGAICLSSFTMSMAAMWRGTDIHTEWSVGYLVLPIVLALTVGVLITSPLGVKVGQRISSAQISYIYGLMLTAVIIKKIAELWYIA